MRRAAAFVSSLFGSLLLLAVPGCSGGSGSGEPDPGAVALESRVTGRFVTTTGQTLAGIHVHVEGQSGMKTLDDGAFSLPIPSGSVHLLGDIGIATFLDTFVATFVGETLDLGDIEVDIQQDSDLDGVADVDEMDGWTILLNLSARRTLTSRSVTSDPGNPDTDGDGLTDGEENAALTDPRRRDSDGDLLPDADEIYRYKSNPVDVDSDEDAAGIVGAQLANPSLYDGQEIAKLGTSPTLADTDGDGLTDYEEITGSGLDPRVADIPAIEITPIGSPEVVLNIERTGSTTSESVRFVVEGTTLTDSTEDIEHTIRSHELNIGLGLSASPSLDISYKAGWTNEHTLTTKTESVAENRKEYTDTVISQLDVIVKDGALSVPMEVRNVSKRTIQITDLSVLAFRVAHGSLRDRIVVGALEPETVSGNPFPAVVLPPGGAFSFVAANDRLPVTTVEDLILHPGHLAFEIGNYTMTQVDALGQPFRDFGATGERVLERCGLVVVDFGGGDVRRAFVATSVERDANGRSAGYGLGRALRELFGFTYTTAAFTRTEGATSKTSTKRSLRSITNERSVGFSATKWSSDPAAANSAHWLVVVTDPSGAPLPESPFVSPTPPNFDDVVLHNGEAAYLVFVTDKDGDGLSDTSEAVLGTNSSSTDTDGDGLSDGFEVTTGWQVKFHAGATGSAVGAPFTYGARSNPLEVDSDGDGDSDATERFGGPLDGFLTSGTDPFLADTDGDGLGDGPDTRSDPPSVLLDLAADPSLLSTWNFDLAGPAFAPSATLPAILGTSRRDLTLPYVFALTDPLDSNGVILPAFDRFGVEGGAHSFEAPFENLSFTLYTSGNNPPDVTSIDNQYSYTAWIRATRTNYDNDWLVLGESIAGSRLVIGEDDRLHFLVLLNDGSSLDVSRSITGGLWHFVACAIAYENGHTVARMYGEDGVLLDSKTGPTGVRPNRPSSPFRAGAIRFDGRTNDPGNRTPVCSLDDVRMYNRAISQELVVKLFRERGFR